MISLKAKVITMSVMTAFSAGLSHGAVVNEGYKEFINVSDRAVADGSAQDGKYPRNTFYKDRHYAIPEGLEIGAYYATWGGYGGRDYKAHQVPVERLNTIYVAFAGICGENPGAYQGGAGLRTSCNGIHAAANGPFYFPTVDKLQDGEVSFIDDNWGLLDKAWEGGKESQSQLAGMMDWKRRNPNLKVIWSIGGWSYSRPFYDMISSSATRAKFVNSLALWLSQPAMDFVDGVDVDFEFPGGLGLDAGKGSPQDGANYLELIKDMRAKLDELAQKNGHKRYELTTAIGVGPNQLKNWGKSSKIGDMMPYLDRLGLMTYDFSGAFSNEVGFNTALGVPQGDQGKGQVNIKTVIETLKRDHGLSDEHLKKTSLGLGFYGRSHGAVANAEPAALPGKASNGSGGGGTVEDGVYSFFDLYSSYIGSEGKGINGWKVYSYPEYGGSLLYNASKQQVINFSSPDDITALTKYAKQMGLKGVFSWQIDDDNGMLLEAVHRAYGNQMTTMQPGKPVVYAPDCKTMLSSGKIQLKPGMAFSSEGQVYALNGWGTKCPNEGEAWEKNSWKLLGSASEILIVGAKPTAGTKVVVANTQPTVPPAADTKPTATPVVDTKPVVPPVADTKPVVAPVVDTKPVVTPVVDPKPVSDPGSTWEAGKVYPSKGSKVVHKGITWESQWWTNGEPGVDAAWKDVTPEVAGVTAAWSAGKAYEKTGSVVTHKGATWRSKWWTNGEPGVDAAWENTTQQPAGTTAAWQQGKVYDKSGSMVTYKGATWKSKWWTNGEPGIDAAWEKN
jgi:chitinase